MVRYEGFTLLEAMVVLAIISLISIMTVPNLIDWRRSAKLRGATTDLKADLEMAKLSAIQHNEHVAVNFADDGYLIFIDEEDGSAGELDDGERILRDRKLAAGVTLSTNFEDSNTRFSGKGTAKAGTVSLVNLDGRVIKVVVSTVGRIRIER